MDGWLCRYGVGKFRQPMMEAEPGSDPGPPGSCPRAHPCPHDLGFIPRKENPLQFAHTQATKPGTGPRTDTKQIWFLI